MLRGRGVWVQAPVAQGAGTPIEGGQSEYLRLPFADGTLEPVPESLADDADDDRLLPLTDVFPTGCHAAVAPASSLATAWS